MGGQAMLATTITEMPQTCCFTLPCHPWTLTAWFLKYPPNCLLILMLTLFLVMSVRNFEPMLPSPPPTTPPPSGPPITTSSEAIPTITGVYIVTSGTATAGESYSLECTVTVTGSNDHHLADGSYGQHDHIWSSDN